MKHLTQKQKLEIGAYLVTIAFAFPLYFLATRYADTPWGDFLINVSATLAGAGFLFFLLNRFFGIEMEKGTTLEQEASAEKFFKNDFDDLRRKVRSAKSVCINGVTLSRTSNSFLNDLRFCVENGGNVKIMVTDPDKSAIEFASKRVNRHQNHETLRRECQIALDNFKTLWNKSQNRKRFEIRLCDVAPTFGVWIIDGEGRNAEIWAEIYSFRGEKDPVIKLTPHKDGVWFDYFKDQFYTLWKVSANCEYSE